jgi:hypothetical protein
MFDSLGSTGGCQDLFTVFPSANGSTAAGTDACPTLNFPKSLDIDMTKGFNGGALSRFGFIEQVIMFMSVQ